MTAPRVSVLLATHNNGAFLKAAVESVLAQSFGDFELLVVDDGSTDDTSRLLQELANNDNRIRLFRNERNRGLIASLNTLLDNARGELIARMDGDDIALPQRLARQVQVMDSDRQLAACGSWMRTLGELRSRVIRYPVTNSEIRATMLFQNPFSHPTMMFRRECFSTGLRYRDKALHAEDYDLYARLPLDCRLANLPEVLYLYRKHPGQVSTAAALEQWATAAMVRREYLQRTGISASEEELEIHGRVRLPAPAESRGEVEALERWLIRVASLRANDPHLQEAVGRQWFFIAVRSGNLGVWTWRKFRRSSLREKARVGLVRQAQLLLLCLTRLRYRSQPYRLMEQLCDV